MWLGDFSRHHMMRDESHNAHLFTRANLDKVQCLINTVTKLDLHMVLPRACQHYMPWPWATT